MNGVHSLQGMLPMALDADGIASGQAFLTGELEARDPRLLEPLVNFTWMRDIVMKTGGGYVDFTSNFFVDYATAGANEHGIIAGTTNNIPILQANVSKDIYKVFPWANNIKVPFLDQQRMTQVGRSLDDIYDKGLRLNYNKMLDQNVYFGFSDYGTTGLINDNNVISSLAPLNEAGSSRAWADKTPTEILADIDNAIVDAWAESEYDPTGIPNHILIDPTNFALINRVQMSLGGVGGFQSIKAYLEANNIAKAQGVDLQIWPCRQCVGAGIPSETAGGNTNRMVLYVNNADRVHADITVPLTRAMTQPSVEQLAFLTAYLSLVGQVKFLYYQCVRYVDGI